MNYLQRKKLAFMSIVNKVKGFIRNVSGIPPLTLPDCVDEDSLINYTINGNSLQNGTPTPENPVEVESVGDYDESTGKYKIPVVCSGKNMFQIRTPDLKGQSAYNGYGGMNYTVYDNSLILSAYTGIGFWFNNLEAGATYTLSCKFLTSGTSGVIFVIGQNQGQSATSTTKKQAWNNQLKEGQYVALTFTADETNLLSFGLGNSVEIEIGEIQLEKNSTRTDYEPYTEPVTTTIYLDKPLKEGETLTNPVRLPTVKGTTIYTVDTTIQPSDMSVTYYSTSKE